MTQDEAFIIDIGAQTGDSPVRQVYADWLKENGQESLGTMMAHLDLLVLSVLRNNLKIRFHPVMHTPPHSFHSILDGYNVDLLWNEQVINSERISLR